MSETDKIVAAYDKLSPSGDELRYALKHVSQTARRYLASRIRQQTDVQIERGRTMLRSFVHAFSYTSSLLQIATRWLISLVQREPVDTHSVSSELAAMYMDLFVNRLAYFVLRDGGDGQEYRPKYDDLARISELRAKEMSNHVGMGRAEFLGIADEIYKELVRACKLRSPYKGLTSETIERHLSGVETVAIFAINPSSQRCKWLMFEAEFDTENFETYLSVLRQSLLEQQVFSVREDTKRGGRLWIFCAEPLPAEQLRLFARNLLQQLRIPARDASKSTGVDIYPKQDRVPAGELGDAVRAPLGISDQKKKSRYWFSYLAVPELSAQIEALRNAPKLTQDQLDDLIARNVA